MINSIVRPVARSVTRSVTGSNSFSGSFLGDLVTNGGFYYDISDVSTLFQDASGTIPVVNDGDPVGLVKDLSSQGRNASQATANNRPTYRTSGGLHWLQFDGVNDSLEIGSIGISGSANRSYLTTTRLQELGDGTDSNETIFSHGPIATGQKWLLRANDFVSGDPLRLEIQGSSYNTSLGLTNNTDYFFACVLDGTTLGDHTIYRNDSSETTSGANTVNTTDSDAKLGVTPANDYTQMLFYGALMVDYALTSEQFNDAKSQLKQLAGIT